MGNICYVDSNGQRRCFYEKERKKLDDDSEDKISSNTNDEKTGTNLNPNPKEKPIIKTQMNVSIVNLNNQKLRDFVNKSIIQGLKENTNDLSFNELKNFEEEELKKTIQLKQGELEKEINKIFKFQKIKELDIDKIIIKEFTDSMIKRKIKAIAKEYEKDKEKFSLKNLKIMLVGRKGTGKTDLIYYIFESEENVEIKKLGDLTEYTCEKYPFLKFVEYRGIGFDKNSNAEIIGMNICDYIESLKTKNYNDFIHCIWYCISGAKFEPPEIALLKKLKSSYQNDSILPVIVVYTKTESTNEANKMEEHIIKQNIDTLFIKTLAKSYEMPNGKIKEAFGRKELLDLTLDKCTKSLQGDLIDLMCKNISGEIQNEMLNDNKKILKNIQEKIVDKFVQEFIQVLEDGDLINYIINIIVDNLGDFYETKITNKTFNFLNNSEFIGDVKKKVGGYKSTIRKMIGPLVEDKAKIFLDKQANIEIEKGNMEINNKRKLNEFKKTTAIFLKKNLYYVSQRLMVSLIINNVYKYFFEDYMKKLNKKIKDILNNQKNKDIRMLLANTFLIKLKDFGDSWDIKIQINKIEDGDPNLPEQRDIEIDEEKQNNNKLITNSFIYIPDENIDENELDENKILNKESIEQKNWFPFEKSRNWKYIKDKLSMDKFLQNLEYQDSYFNEETEDQIFSSLKTSIKNDLINFLIQNKLEFIKSLDQIYSNKKFPFEQIIIQKIMESENISSIYDKKIKNEIDLINNNKNEINIKYITIIVLGRSGIGKSELINCLLKENKAEVGVGFRVTLQNNIYKNDNNNNLSFLRLIDTRGTEIDVKVGLDKIKKNAFDMIDKMKLEAKKNNDYNCNIQCIYYCVKGASLEESEIKTIEELKNNKDSIPLIVVFTKGVNMTEIKSMGELITDRLKVPFINVLSKDIEDQKSYGLDDLLQLTLDECQRSTKGNLFKAIELKICERVKKNLKKINKNIKYNIGQNMLQKFINFKKVVNKTELFGIIYSYLEIPFLDYMHFDQNEDIILKEESRNEFKNLKIINNYIKDFIDWYQKKSKEIVEPYLEDASLKFLDMQVKNEKKLSKSIEVENKNNKESFKKIISKFLNSNFYYISQKYLIYRFLSDFSEPFSEELEKKINEIITNNLEKDVTKKLIMNSYEKIFNEFRQTIIQKSKNGKFYEDTDEVGLNNNNNLDNYYQTGLDMPKNEMKNDLACPYPYPSF